MATPRWTDERTTSLEEIVGDVQPVSRETVASAAETLGTSSRSVSSKLRKMGYDVESATAAPRSFTEKQETTLSEFLSSNSGMYTYAELAETFADGEFSAKQLQGKILSMELTEHVKKAEKVAPVRTYSEDEEETFVHMANNGASLEALSEALGRPINSIRGKALSLYRSGHISAIPKQEVTKAPAVDPMEALGDVSGMTVAEIAEELNKSPRGVKVMLTRRGLVAADYDGAAKAEKAAKAAAA